MEALFCGFNLIVVVFLGRLFMASVFFKCTLVMLLVFGCTANKTEVEYIEGAKSYISSGEFEAAVIELKNSLADNPSGAEARFLLGKTYFYIGDLESSEKELLLAVEYGKDKGGVFLILGRVLLLRGEYDRLKELDLNGLESVSRASLLAMKGLANLSLGNSDEAERLVYSAYSEANNSPFVLTAKARLLASKGDYSRAREELSASFSIDPMFPDAWSLMGDIEYHEGDYKAAEVSYGNSISGYERRDYDRVKRAVVRVMSGDFDAARFDVDALSERYGEYPGIGYVRGVIDFKERRFKSSLKNFSLAEMDVENYPYSLLYIALIHFLEGSLERSEDYVNRFLSVFPENDVGGKLLSRLYLADGRFSEAQSILERIISHDEIDDAARNLLAVSLIKQGDAVGANEHLNYLVQKNPLSSSANLKLGMGMILAGDGAGGISYVEKSLHVSPGDYLANRLLISGYLHNDSLDMALDVAKEFNYNSPETSASHNLLGRVYLAAEDKKKAVDEFNKARDISPGDPYSNQVLAALSIQDKDFSRARKYYLDVLGNHPNNTTVLMNLAGLEFIDGDELSMVSYLNKVLSVNPNLITARLSLAKYYLSLKKYDDVYFVLRGADEDDLDRVDYLEILVLTDLARNNYLSAAKGLVRILEKKPDSAVYHNLMAVSYVGLGDAGRAYDEFLMSVDLDGNYIPGRVGLARHLLISGRLLEAADQLKILKGLASEDVSILQLEAALASLEGDHKLSLNNYEKIFEMSPSAGRLLMLTRQMWGMGDEVPVARLQERWLRKNPSDIPVRLALAEIYMLMGKVDKSIYNYKKVIDFDRDNFKALNRVAWHIRSSSTEEALSYAHRAVSVQPDSSYALDTLSMVLLNAGKIPEAIRNIDRAMRISPNNKSMIYHGALIYAASGDEFSAVKLLKSLPEEEDFPEKVKAYKLLGELDRTSV